MRNPPAARHGPPGSSGLIGDHTSAGNPQSSVNAAAYPFRLRDRRRKLRTAGQCLSHHPMTFGIQPAGNEIADQSCTAQVRASLGHSTPARLSTIRIEIGTPRSHNTTFFIFANLRFGFSGSETPEVVEKFALALTPGQALPRGQCAKLADERHRDADFEAARRVVQTLSSCR